MATMRVSKEMVAHFITTALEGFRAKVDSENAFMSVGDLAAAIGSSADAVEKAVREMDNATVIEAEDAAKLNQDEGVPFTLVARKGKNAKGNYPGVRLLDEAAAKAARAAKEQGLRAARYLKDHLIGLGIPERCIQTAVNGSITIYVGPLVTYKEDGSVAESIPASETVLALFEE